MTVAHDKEDGMNSTYIYLTTDGDGNDPRSYTLEASGIGEAGQMAYSNAEDEDRHVIAVFEAALSHHVLEMLARVAETAYPSISPRPTSPSGSTIRAKAVSVNPPVW